MMAISALKSHSLNITPQRSKGMRTNTVKICFKELNKISM